MTDSPEPQTPAGPTLADRLGVVARGGLLLAVLVFIGMAVRGQQRPLDEGVAAPELPMRSYDGRAWDLSRFEGKPVVVNFWGSWCPPCLQEMPHFVRAARGYGDQLIFVGATVNSPRDDVFHVLERFGVPYPIAEVDSATVNRWNARSLPSTYVLDARHHIVWSTSGAITGKQLERVVAEKLSIPPPSHGDG